MASDCAQDGNLRVDIVPGDKLRAMLKDDTTGDESKATASTDQAAAKAGSPAIKYSDIEPVIAFLTGRNCLTGVRFKSYKCFSKSTLNRFLLYRVPAGGNTNYATVAMCVNSMWTKTVKHL